MEEEKVRLQDFCNLHSEASRGLRKLDNIENNLLNNPEFDEKANIYGEKLGKDEAFDTIARKLDEYFKTINLTANKWLEIESKFKRGQLASVEGRLRSLVNNANKSNLRELPKFFLDECNEQYDAIGMDKFDEKLKNIDMLREALQEAYKKYASNRDTKELKKDLAVMKTLALSLNDNEEDNIKDNQLNDKLIDAITDENVDSLITVIYYHKLVDEQA